MPWSATLSSYVLASEPELSDLIRHLVGAFYDLFIRSSPMVYHLALIEAVVEDGTDGAIREWPAI
jgi:hypothetical protein